MLQAFENTIEELKLLSMRMEERTGKLESSIRAETKSHAKRVAQLQEHNKVRPRPSEKSCPKRYITYRLP